MRHLSSSSFPHASNEHIAGHCEPISEANRNYFSTNLHDTISAIRLVFVLQYEFKYKTFMTKLMLLSQSGCIQLHNFELTKANVAWLIPTIKKQLDGCTFSSELYLPIRAFHKLLTKRNHLD